jgi:hypothetical protein
LRSGSTFSTSDPLSAPGTDAYLTEMRETSPGQELLKLKMLNPSTLR